MHTFLGASASLMSRHLNVSSLLKTLNDLPHINIRSSPQKSRHALASFDNTNNHIRFSHRGWCFLVPLASEISVREESFSCHPVDITIPSFRTLRDSEIHRSIHHVLRQRLPDENGINTSRCDIYFSPG